MSEPHQRGMFGAADLDGALAGLAEERRRIKELQETVAETSTVVHSKDRMLSVTFNGRGELDKLTFSGTRYRRVAPTELAKVITETLAAGRNQAMEKLGGMMGSEVLPGVKFEDMATGNVDVNEVIDGFLGAALAGLPDKVLGRFDQARLRGEL
jgi:DNA-binding protein YbaB